MTFQVSGRISIDAKAAKAELEAVSAATTKVKTTTAGLGAEGRETAADFAALKGELASYKLQLQAMSAAEVQAMAKIDAMTAEYRQEIAALQAQMGGLGRGAGGAAGSIGNLTAQFNDIGMMLMAGQNPLQLAIQQGTQISQVIGPMGAGGAVRALATAFMGMLNPISLITMGSIAAGAAMIQWLTDSDGKATSLEDALGDLKSGVDAYAASSHRARGTTEELTRTFGNQHDEIRALLVDMTELERREAERAAKAAASSARDGVMENRWLTLDFSDQATTAKFFDLDTQVAGVWQQVNGLIGAFDRLGDATSIDQQIAAAERLRTVFLEAAAASGDITAEEDEVLRQIFEMIEGLRRFKAEQVEAAYESSGLADLMTSIRDVLSDASDTNLSHIFSDADGPAAALLAKAEALGVKLAAMARAAATAEGTATGSPYVAPQVRGTGAYSPGNITFGNPFGGPSAAPGSSPRPRAAPTSIDFGVPKSSAGGGGGKTDAERQADALAKLIAKEQEQLDVLRETDPVQKEMLRNREALAGATEKERQQVEALITARISEQEIAKQTKETWDFLGKAGVDALTDLIGKGKDAGEVFSDLKNILIEAALQAMIMGEGPLAGFFGVSGAIWDGLSGAPAKAGGGMIYGPGSGTSDDVLMWGSNGEFVVNAAATRKNRHLLEAINAGSGMPGFARGGAVGGGAAPDGRDGGTAGLQINLDMRGVQGDKTIEDRVAAGISRAFEEHNRTVLPQKIKAHIRDQRKIG